MKKNAARTTKIKKCILHADGRISDVAFGLSCSELPAGASIVDYDVAMQTTHTVQKATRETKLAAKEEARKKLLKLAAAEIAKDTGLSAEVKAEAAKW